MKNFSNFDIFLLYCNVYCSLTSLRSTMSHFTVIPLEDYMDADYSDLDYSDLDYSDPNYSDDECECVDDTLRDPNGKVVKRRLLNSRPTIVETTQTLTDCPEDWPKDDPEFIEFLTLR